MRDQNPVFIPGPTNIPETLRRACDIPTLDHRAPAFAEILHPARAGVAAVMKARKAEVFILPATGTGGWEVALSNTLSPGDTVLACRNGMFSHRWIDMCARLGLDVIVIEADWGDGIPVDQMAETLASDHTHRIRAVLATHNETATGVTSDIAAIRAAMDRCDHPALLLVDGVSSIGSMDFRFDDWRVDIAVTGSQKGFMLPAGLAITAFSPKALEARRRATLPRCFFDTEDMEKSYAANGYPFTPAVGLLNGLKLSCDMLLSEGLATVFARHRRIADGVRAAAQAWNMPLCARAPELYSDTVTAIRTPDGFDATEIVSHAMRAYGVAFGTGLGEVAGKVFRIGHLGQMSDVMALSGISTAEMCMVDLGLPIKPGSGVAAAQAVYRRGAPSLDQKEAA